MFKLFEIDLTSKTVQTREIGGEILRQYLGGRGLGVRLMLEHMQQKISNLKSQISTNPRSEDFPIFFLTGLLTGSNAPLSGRFHSVFKSPLTGTICDSSCGGRTGVYLKKQGIGGLVIKGASSSPVYLYISKSGVSFEDASQLTGKGTGEKEAMLKQIYGQDISTILVGPAGENGVLFASASSDRRFFGRGGLGALMGAKNLSGVVVEKGENTLSSPHDVERYNFTVEEVKKWLHGNPITSQGLPEFGTSVLMNLINEMNTLPHKNFAEMRFERADSISGEALQKKVIKRRACYGCMVACGRVTAKGEGPEYETLWALGANLGISDIDYIMELNELCYQYGMDTISLGGSLACYMEIKGAPFGDKTIVKALVEKTAKKEGEGALIALGSKRFATELGKPELSMSVKGMELPAYHPKGLYGMALAYGTSNRGGCHLRSYMIGPEVLGIPKMMNRKIGLGKSGIVIYLQNSHAAADSAIYCRFLSIAVTDEYLSRMVSSYMPQGGLTTQEYLKNGERIYTLERLFNNACGFSRKDDYLPQRLMFDEYDDMLSEYYRARNWDEDGSPSHEKLEELGLDLEFGI